MAWYQGDDVHAYSGAMRTRMSCFETIANKPFSGTESLLVRLEACVPLNDQARIGLENIRRNVVGGEWLRDPDLGINLNILWILDVIVAFLERSDTDLSIKMHFVETLSQIGNTCIQGITHRLAGDFLALC